MAAPGNGVGVRRVQDCQSCFNRVPRFGQPFMVLEEQAERDPPAAQHLTVISETGRCYCFPQALLRLGRQACLRQRQPQLRSSRLDSSGRSMRSARVCACSYVRSAGHIARVALRQCQPARRRKRVLRPALAIVGGEHPPDRLNPPLLIAEVMTDVGLARKCVERRLVIRAEPRIQDRDKAGQGGDGPVRVTAGPVYHFGRHLLGDLVWQMLHAREKWLVPALGRYDLRAQGQCGGRASARHG